jgi:hypothetical protein
VEAFRTRVQGEPVHRIRIRTRTVYDGRQQQGEGVEAFRTRVQGEPVHRITIRIRTEYDGRQQEGGIDGIYP